jgi:ferredoxin
MAYVVTQHCVDCKYTDCVTVCPVDAFHQGERMLYINPDTCVNCDACVPACPVEAIYSEENLPASYQQWLQINIEGSRNHPILNQKKDPLPGAKPLDELKSLDDKGFVPPPPYV